MNLAFMGHLCVDENVVRGVPHILYGGGVLHGAVTAHRLQPGGVTAYTKCAPDDRPRFTTLHESGARVVFLPSETSTSIRNDYPTENPDDRVSRLVSRAAPFTADDLAAAGPLDVLHVNPLWLGEFPPALLPLARERARVLGCDAQGLLRAAVDADGRCALRDLPGKAELLPLLDLLKVDVREAEVLTGVAEPRAAARRLRAMGARLVLLTHGGGVCVHDGQAFHEAPFVGATLEGRTGRGDTCTAAFLTARFRQDRPLDECARFAAEVTSRKMQYRGPYRG